MGIKMPKMGTSKNLTKLAPRGSLVDALFLGTQQRVLGLLFGLPQNPSFESKSAGFGWLKSGIGIRARQITGHNKDATPNRTLPRQRRVTRHC